MPSAAVFALDETSAAVVETLRGGHLAAPDLYARLAPRFDPRTVEDSLAELAGARVIQPVEPAAPAVPPPGTGPEHHPAEADPLSTLVVNVTNRCNLSCAYCYEYGGTRLPNRPRAACRS